MSENEQEFSFYTLFVPLTTKKAIYILIVIGIIVYFNALFGQFVWDDVYYIANNPYVHTPANIFSVFVSHNDPIANGRFYRALTFSIYTLLYSFFGQNTFFYHLLELVLTIANASFIFLIFKKFFKTTLAFSLALFSLIHPLNSELVAYIDDLQDVLYFFFGIFAFFLFQKFEIPTGKQQIVIASLLTLSLLAKETGILFLLLILFFSYFLKRKAFKVSAIISISVLCTYAFIRYVIGSNRSNGSSSLSGSIFHYVLLSEPKIVFFYIKNFLFPNNFAINQLWLIKSISFNDFYFPLFVDSLAILVIGFSAWFIWKKKKEHFSIFSFFLVWFVLGMILCLPVWLLDQTVAYRWMYFPMVGLLGMAGVLFTNLQIKKHWIKLICYVFVVVVIIFSFITIQRNSNFQTRLSLYSHDAPIANNVVLYRLLADELIQYGDYKGAVDQLKNLKRLDSNSYWFYKGLIDEKMDNDSEAIADFTKLFGTKDEHIAYEAIPQILMKKKENYKEARILLVKGTKKYPDNLTLHRLLTIVEYKLTGKHL